MSETAEGNFATNFTVDELLVGQTSGAQAYLVEKDTTNNYLR